MSQPANSTQPVFTTARELPHNVDTYEICAAAEKTAGRGSMMGAQRIGALWRLYPRDRETRVKLLIEGITIKNQKINLHSQNPFIVRGNYETPSTRLSISDVPISYSNTMLETNLTKLGVKIRSKITMEKVRDRSGNLTDWVTGRRIVWIEMPATTLPFTTQIGPFKAWVYYREQKNVCRRCFRQGHKTEECKNEEACMKCGKPGHRKSDGKCETSSLTENLDHLDNEPGRDEREDMYTENNNDGEMEEGEVSSGEEANENDIDVAELEGREEESDNMSIVKDVTNMEKDNTNVKLKSQESKGTPDEIESLAHNEKRNEKQKNLTENIRKDSIKDNREGRTEEKPAERERRKLKNQKEIGKKDSQEHTLPFFLNKARSLSQKRSRPRSTSPTQEEERKQRPKTEQNPENKQKDK
ncbi:hypothetical protein ElyMa_004993300 [Elysia marginata]|uniref:CCHC-type domain-containing protein n=1 Tax=Elysia marginata TaxID=1093978 RepID=A0AAV4J647_9GAST|nr:hypothetical protein ElyMa_004993300 [Elysia marginata]